MFYLAKAQDYPLLNLFWTMLWLFLWILWIFLLIRIISDIFRSHDLNGWGKSAWCLFVILLPFLGVLMYLIFRGGEMQNRDIASAQAANAAMTDYIRQTAGTTPSTAEELTKLAELHSQGVLTEAEFAAQKAKLLG